MTRDFVTALCLVLGCACGDAADSGGIADTMPSRSVSQSGPQDVGELRRVVEEGAVPSLALLDERGFLAEHAFDLPPSTCGAPVCAHPMLAVAPRFDLGNWSMAFIALGTSVEPEDLPARPRHLVVVTDAWSLPFESGGDFGEALRGLVGSLGPEDVVSVIDASYEPRRLAEGLPSAALDGLETPAARSESQAPDAYGGLADALDLVTTPAHAERASHVVLVTTGVPNDAMPTQASWTPRIRSLSAFEALAQRFAAAEVPVSVIGLASEGYTRTVPSAIAEITDGQYAFATDARDLADAASALAKTAFVPLAKNLRIELRAATGYRIGRVFGAPRAVTSGDRVTLESPVLYLGARIGASDVGSGRRGGGGGFFVQLLADEEGPVEEADAFELVVSYDDAATGERHEQRATLATPLGVGRSPSADAAFFSDAPRAKPFMALNMYLALRAALRLYEGHGCGGSLGIQSMMQTSYEYWHRTYSDPDIDADFDLLEKLIENIEARCDQSLYEVPMVELGCFWT